MDEWCNFFVNILDIDAVAFDVPETGAGGVRVIGATLRFVTSGTGCSSSIFRRHEIVCFAMQSSEEDEDSSTGGVIGRAWW